MDSKKAFEDLKLVKKVCDICKIPFFLTCGTALGIYRDGEFLIDDKDIDIGIIGRDKREIIKDGLKENDFRVIQFNPKFTGYHLTVKRNIVIDVHFFDREGDFYQCYVKYQKPCISFPAEFGKFKKINFKGLKFDSPALTEKYLTYVYGNWKDKTSRKSAKNG